MNHLRNFSLFIFSALALFFSITLSAAENVSLNVCDDNVVTVQPRAEDAEEEASIVELLQNWHREKDEVFRIARKQDKFIFLLIGRYECPRCHATIAQFKDEQLSKIVDNEYILWFSYRDSSKRQKEVQIYVDEMYATMAPTSLPLFFIIDPNDSTKTVKYNFSYKIATYLANFMAFDLPIKQGLKWYEDTSVIFEMAKNQKKLILKFVGTGTSNNSKEMLKLLESSPLSQMLNDNYILWYKRHIDAPVKTSSDVFTQDVPDTEDNEDLDDAEIPEEIIKTAPYIYIIDPEYPNVNIAEIWGLQDVETLKDLLEDPVSNENINLSDNKVSLKNNTLYISNSTDSETISVYSIAGQRIDVFQKSEPSITVNASSFPNGVLIIHSSKGWSAKVIKN